MYLSIFLSTGKADGSPEPLTDLAFGIVMALFFFTLIIVFCVILIRLYFRKIRNYTAQLYQKDLDFQKTLTITVIETQEQVLQNISQDLHDDAGQQLTYLNFQLENLKFDAPELSQSLEPLSQAVSELSASIRGISHSLNYQLITRQDLPVSVEKEVERLNRQKKIRFVLHQKGPSKLALPPGHEIVVYRIFQECIQNLLKHAQATEVSITIETAPFSLVIEDNGKGFERSATSGPTLGLQNLYARAALLGYRLDIDTAPGKGTKVTLTAST